MPPEDRVIHGTTASMAGNGQLQFATASAPRETHQEASVIHTHRSRWRGSPQWQITWLAKLTLRLSLSVIESVGPPSRDFNPISRIFYPRPPLDA